MGFLKTIDHSRRTAQDTASAIEAQVDHSRDTAAGLLSRTATRVRHGSKRASKVIARGGSGVADRLEGAAEQVGHRPRGPIGLVRNHPLRLLFAAGLFAALVALLLTRRTMAGHDEDGV